MKKFVIEHGMKMREQKVPLGGNSKLTIRFIILLQSNEGKTVKLDYRQSELCQDH